MDLSLRARIRAGDAQAFALLFRQHAQAVHAHAARWLGDPGPAEDVVSLTFLEAWRLREKLLDDDDFAARTRHGTNDNDDGLRAWLFGIATNVLRNTRRAARRHKAALDRLPDRRPGTGTVPDFADILIGRLEDAERLAAAAAALRQLRPREREVFALCVWSELSYADAATALRVPVSTVRSRLARARQRLRQLAESELAGRTGAPAGRDMTVSGGRTRRLPARGQEPDDRAATARSAQERDR
ncbi:RNA polymerase sigma factor [Streptomyces flavofungini]|uniref:RNA polymerase sigma factor n=1 Tax=Streptomyces flavofungini TaxID=68200 RepID=UPI0025B098FB|nr:sigma-70 family RNA polymerase sigma factor [Streptomyces flavofungini]WJV44125.1 sigma-70 family RNA polymerase sigma factor [Streptomyces flavofungini]